MKMKKILRTIALSVSILTLACAPTYAYAETLPVCTINQPDNMSYEYQSGPRVINSEVVLTNYNGPAGAYVIPANKTSHYIVNCNTAAPYRVQILMISPATTVVYSNIVTVGGTYFTIPANSYERTILLMVLPTSSTPIYLSSYSFMYD
jgi:hypothetical protein